MSGGALTISNQKWLGSISLGCVRRQKSKGGLICNSLTALNISEADERRVTPIDPLACIHFSKYQSEGMDSAAAPASTFTCLKIKKKIRLRYYVTF